MLNVYQKFNDYLRKSPTNSSTRTSWDSQEPDQSKSELVNSISVLPEEILLNIFSYLSLEDLCKCSSVSPSWHRISNDPLLWTYKLVLESYKWVGIISNNTPIDKITHPKDLFTSIIPISSLSSKELIRSGFFVYFSLILKSYLGRKSPHIATFGPGLDNSRTRKLFNRMFRNNCPEFEPTGQFMPAVGSGVTMRLISDDNYPYKFHFYMLYASKTTTKETAPNLQEKRIRESALFERLDDHQPLDELKVQEIAKEIFVNLNGLIYSIDANDSDEDFRCLVFEFRLALSLIRTDVPVLVIVINSEKKRPSPLSTFQIAQLFDLFRLPNPWCVLTASVKDLLVVKLGIIWLIQKTFKM